MEWYVIILAALSIYYYFFIPILGQQYCLIDKSKVNKHQLLEGGSTYEQMPKQR